MSKDAGQSAWIERVEALVQALEGSSVEELELSENDLEIVIRRRPDMVLVAAPSAPAATGAPAPARGASAGVPTRTAREDHSVPVLAPLSGVYYAAPSPDSPPFVSVGDVIQVGQVVALIEAMKYFHEVQAEVAGRVTRILFENGAVVQNGDVLMLVEPL
jgi:acetyl-CoA carboxylase biotin carboxyl carrier protein